jgi:hypothetical protein
VGGECLERMRHCESAAADVAISLR